MNPAVEQIVSSDEAARTTVQHAEKEAAKLIDDAEKKSRSMLAALEEQIKETERRDILPIVSGGRQQAELTIEQAEQYIKMLRQKFALKKTKIIAAFINNVVKTGMD